MIYNSQVTQSTGRQNPKGSTRFDSLRTSPFKYTNQSRLRGRGASITVI